MYLYTFDLLLGFIFLDVQTDIKRKQVVNNSEKKYKAANHQKFFR